MDYLSAKKTQEEKDGSIVAVFLQSRMLLKFVRPVVVSMLGVASSVLYTRNFRKVCLKYLPKITEICKKMKYLGELSKNFL